MLRLNIFSFLLVGVAALPATAAPPKIVVFGAEWCGSCPALRTFLAENGVVFDYLDIDQPANRERFAAVTGDRTSIPLTLIDGEKVRGASFADLKLILERKGVKLPGVVNARSPSGEDYGGFPAAWWETQFKTLRSRLVDAQTREQNLEKVAVDDYERGVALPRLKLDVKIISESLDQLETDASRADLPRMYRAY